MNLPYLFGILEDFTQLGFPPAILIMGVLGILAVI
jgi:hypothetical protein